MHHHFDGIIIPEFPDSGQSHFDGETRRDVLRHFVAGGAALAVANAALADDKQSTDKAAPAKPGDYDRYVVFPKDFRRFRTDRRTKLGIGGGFFRVLDPKSKRSKSGFLAWLTKADVKRIAAEEDVIAVQKITAEQIPGPGTKRGKATQLMVRLLPNGWRRGLPPKGSYVATSELIDTWSKAHKTVKFKPSRSQSMVLINIGPAGMPAKMLASLKSHRQVAGIHWNSVATTLALGEEGATTKALGEEGASTRRRGEEGGKVTTLAVGEEGGKVTTKALREEGGKITTKAFGEEAGKRPKYSTQALGEEGGRKRR